jgi:hypothetical protein
MQCRSPKAAAPKPASLVRWFRFIFDLHALFNSHSRDAQPVQFLHNVSAAFVLERFVQSRDFLQSG